MMALEVEAMFSFVFHNRIQEIQSGLETPVVLICTEIIICVQVFDRSIITNFLFTRREKIPGRNSSQLLGHRFLVLRKSHFDSFRDGPQKAQGLASAAGRNSLSKNSWFQCWLGSSAAEKDVGVVNSDLGTSHSLPDRQGGQQHHGQQITNYFLLLGIHETAPRIWYPVMAPGVGTRRARQDKSRKARSCHTGLWGAIGGPWLVQAEKGVALGTWE